MRNKIGILGGTFNPVHNGHLRLALSAYEQYNLDEVWIMISPAPPHKAASDILDIKIRIEMIRLAVCDYPDKLKLSLYELERKGYVYTADTLTMLNEEYPDTEFYFIMGGDSLKNLEKWYKPQVIMEKAVILTAIRNDVNTDNILKHAEHLKEKYGADVKVLKLDSMPISSTVIRENIKNNIDVSGMLPARVEEYIKNNGLYKLIN